MLIGVSKTLRTSYILEIISSAHSWNFLVLPSFLSTPLSYFLSLSLPLLALSLMLHPVLSLLPFSLLLLSPLYFTTPPFYLSVFLPSISLSLSFSLSIPTFSPQPPLSMLCYRHPLGGNVPLTKLTPARRTHKSPSHRRPEFFQSRNHSQYWQIHVYRQQR